MLQNDYPRPLQSPLYSVTCDCGVTITGYSEKKLNTLLELHIESGIIHLMTKINKHLIDKKNPPPR